LSRADIRLLATLAAGIAVILIVGIVLKNGASLGEVLLLVFFGYVAMKATSLRIKDDKG
jgi:hypothetical protein